MKFDEIMKLLDAGYTKDEILAMKEEAGSDPEDQKEPENPEPAGNDKAVDVSAIIDTLGEVKTVFEDFKKEMIAMNIMNSRIDADPEQSVDDILAEIINPFETK